MKRSEEADQVTAALIGYLGAIASAVTGGLSDMALARAHGAGARRSRWVLLTGAPFTVSVDMSGTLLAAYAPQ